MNSLAAADWKGMLVEPKRALEHVEPGMSIFLGSGLAEPRTLLAELMRSDKTNTKDLELIQLTSHSDILSLKNLDLQNYRLKTFFSGWAAGEAVESSCVDLVPARFSQIPAVFRSERVRIDAAFVQITPPDPLGFCSLGLSADVAREAMERASLVIGEIQPQAPFTLGDTIVSLADFDMLVESDRPLPRFERFSFSEELDRAAGNIASIIQDGDCVCFHTGGPLFEALCRHLGDRRGLGVHSPYFTDALMDLVKSGAVNNYRKGFFRGKSVASYVLGTPELSAWLHRNPLVEMQGVAEVCNPVRIGSNPNFAAIFQASKVDLSGRVAFDIGKGSLTSGPGLAADLIGGTELSPGGRTIFGLSSRDADGRSNIEGVLADRRNQFHMHESIDMVVTEYGVANLKWRSIRERAQAVIDIAHPDDRPQLVEHAKKRNFLFQDQIFLSQSARCYPGDAEARQTFKDGVKVRFRAVRPSDEEAMRRLFYRFSGETVYRRFFYPITTMPHGQMQEYVNVDYRRVMSVVALIGESDNERIIAEARFELDDDTGFGEIAFAVDERYHGLGIGTYLYEMLARLARKRGLKGFTAEVLEENKYMMRILEKAAPQVDARLRDGVYSVTIPFDEDSGGA